MDIEQRYKILEAIACESEHPKSKIEDIYPYQDAYVLANIVGDPNYIPSSEDNFTKDL